MLHQDHGSNGPIFNVWCVVTSIYIYRIYIYREINNLGEPNPLLVVAGIPLKQVGILQLGTIHYIDFLELTYREKQIHFSSLEKHG